jgi:hypothetical protein
MATPESIVRPHADQPIVRTYVLRPRHTIASQARSARWSASMATIAKAQDLASRPPRQHVASRPSIAATLERLRSLRTQVRPRR